jgi:hypothetical protein
MCYKAEEYISSQGRQPVTEFILDQDKETQDWIFSGIGKLEKNKGKLNNEFLETKHIYNKILELKFKKLPVRILFSYHPNIRKKLLLLHGVLKKTDKLKPEDIKTANDRYNEMKQRG